jgi:hypothetical protein
MGLSTTYFILDIIQKLAIMHVIEINKFYTKKYLLPLVLLL